MCGAYKAYIHRATPEQACCLFSCCSSLSQPQTISHLFLECPAAATVISWLCRLWHAVTGHMPQASVATILANSWFLFCCNSCQIICLYPQTLPLCILPAPAVRKPCAAWSRSGASDSRELLGRLAVTSGQAWLPGQFLLRTVMCVMLGALAHAAGRLCCSHGTQMSDQHHCNRHHCTPDSLIGDATCFCAGSLTTRPKGWVLAEVLQLKPQFHSTCKSLGFGVLDATLRQHFDI